MTDDAEGPPQGSASKGRRVLVIGAGGFIGAKVVEKLASEPGVRVTAALRSARKDLPYADAGIEVCELDLGDRAGLAEAVRGQDVVINTAHDFRASLRSNLRGFTNLLDACVAAEVERLVHTSSVVVYDDWPEGEISEQSPRSAEGSDYKRAKVRMEEMLSERAARGELSSIVIQPTIVYGPRGWIWTDQILERLRSGTVVLPERCEGACHAVHVDDVADALVLAAFAPRGEADLFIVSGPAPVTWREFFETWNRVLGTDSIRYAEMNATEESSVGAFGAIRSLVSNPMQVASWKPVQRILGALRRAIGEPTIERIRARLMALSQKRGPVVFYPSPDEIRLYGAKGQCHIEAARERLGYSPALDFEQGARRTADHLPARPGPGGVPR
jgi:nucleoside-diphosphate-sugar epimerase